MFCQHCGQEIGEAYVRKLIRDELRHLDQETTAKLTEQIATRIARSQISVSYRPHWETKVVKEEKSE